MNAAAKVIDDIVTERANQEAKWGEQNHPFPIWTAILGEEYGEFCHAVNEMLFGKGDLEEVRGHIVDIYQECLQTAAVAVAICEMMQRKWHKTLANHERS